MKRDIIKNTLDELKGLNINARLSNVLVTKSTVLGTPWTFSYVVHDDGYTSCGTGNNCFDVPLDISFIRELLDLDAYEAADRLGQMKSSRFNNSLLISIASALSCRIMGDEAFLKSQGYSVKMLPQAALGAIVDLGMITGSDTVAIVGYFYSFVAKIAEVAREVIVTELAPSSDFDVYDFKPGKSNVRICSASQNKDVISNADVVIMTGMTLANDTATELLEYAKNARIVMMQGPTCSFYPKALFEAGVDVVGTVLLPGDDHFQDLLVNSRGYWYNEKELKHVLISAKEIG